MAKKIKNKKTKKPAKKKKRAFFSSKKKKTKAVLKLKSSPQKKNARAKVKVKIKVKVKAKPRVKAVSVEKEIKEPREVKTFFPEQPVKKTRIRVIGIGGGGGTIISEISNRIQKASFIAANTDSQALNALGKRVVKFHFGQNLTQGLGTGMNANIGQEAAFQEKDKISKVLDGQDLTVFVVSLGGGTGSGAAPVFAKISRALGNLNYGIFTLPFKFEGEKKMEIALESLKKIRPYLNAFSVIPNERVFQVIDKNTPLKDALSAVNKNLTEGLEGLIETIYEPGLINIDFADFKTILDGQGRLAYLHSVSSSKNEGSRQDLINKVISSALYPYGIRGAKSVLFDIAGEKDLALAEVSQISRTISDLVSKDAKIIFGISQGKQYANAIKITLLATGCALKNIQPEDYKPKIKLMNIIKKEDPEAQEEKKETIIKKAEKPAVDTGNKISKPAMKGKKKNEKKAPVPIKKTADLKTEIKNNEEAAEQQERTRKNAMQLRMEIEAEEKEIEAREQVWDTPAFLRQKKS